MFTVMDSELGDELAAEMEKKGLIKTGIRQRWLA